MSVGVWRVVYEEDVNSGFSPGFPDRETAELWVEHRVETVSSQADWYHIVEEGEGDPLKRRKIVDVKQTGWSISTDYIATHDSINSSNEYGDIYP